MGHVAKARVFVIEDDGETRAALLEVLEGLGHSVESAPDAEHALAALQESEVDAVLTDVRLPGLSGIELCRRLSGDQPNLAVVVMTAFGDVDSAVGALRAGACDFITKPFSIDALSEVLERALRRDRMSPVVALLAETWDAEATTHGLVGSSGPMRALRSQISRAATSDASVLITGESGTGKELVARAIHGHGQRRAGPLVAFSCAAVPAELAEAELFGHAKGAFTDAVTERTGFFGQASGGTIFLDEIGELPLTLQSKLLRALQERAVRPIGSAHEVPFDARVISATNRDLDEAVQRGLFRSDLLFRIKVLDVHVPPLRERREDVPELARHFLRAASAQVELGAEAEQCLLAYDWPGNVRELENAMRAAAALSRGPLLSLDELPRQLRVRRAVPVARSGDQTLEAMERRHIETVLRVVGWNMMNAARRLGIDRATLYRKLDRFGIARPSRSPR